MKRKIKELTKESEKGEDLSKEYENEFLEAIDDDLNTPITMQLVWKMLDDENYDSNKKLKLLEKFDGVLGLDLGNVREEKIEISKDIKELINLREKLRKEKKWAEADLVRGRIKEKGYLVEDTSEGIKVLKID